MNHSNTSRNVFYVETSGNKLSKKDRNNHTTIKTGSSKHTMNNTEKSNSTITTVADLQQQNKATNFLMSTATRSQGPGEATNIVYNQAAEKFFVPKGLFMRQPQSPASEENTTTHQTNNKKKRRNKRNKTQRDCSQSEGPRADVTPMGINTHATLEEEVVSQQRTQPDVAPQELQVAVAPEESQPAPHQQKITLDDLRLLKAMATDPAHVFFQQTGIQMAEVAELDFMVDQDEETIRLQDQQEALLAEVAYLEEMLQTETALDAELDIRYETRLQILQLELIEQEAIERESLRKVRKMEEALEKEKIYQKEVETSLDQQREENSRLLTAMAQTQDDLNKEKLQWKEELSTLLQSVQSIQDQLQQEKPGQHFRDKVVDLQQKIAKDKKSKT